MKNYIIGYGSLMNIKSLQKTLSEVSYIEPVFLHNYTREWNAIEKKTKTLSTTFLGIKEGGNIKTNCIIFEISKNNLEYLDKREFLYTRKVVDFKNVELYKNSTLNIYNDDKIWIYIVDNPQASSKDFPIIQSYIDTCLSGCIELGIKFNIPLFADYFVQTTQNWSTYWVNDRIFPRAPHIHQPYAYEIDAILYKKLPKEFKGVTIE